MKWFVGEFAGYRANVEDVQWYSGEEVDHAGQLFLIHRRPDRSRLNPYQTRSDVANTFSPDKETWLESSTRGARGRGNKALSEPVSGLGFALPRPVQ
jgi:hypothetical protein